MGDRLVRKGLVLGIIFLFVCTNLVSGFKIQLKNTTIPLINSRGYIQGLIDNATDGDTIFIPSGTYYENIIINKSINLIGEDEYSTIIDGNRNSDVVSIFTDWVNLSGFTIKNCSWAYSGININSNFNTIKDNIIIDNGRGILLNSYSRNNTVTNNYFSVNSNCISLSYSSGNNIRGNSFGGNGGDCIYLEESCNNNIEDNYISDHLVDKGIVLIDSINNTIKGNTISSHYNYDDGIYLLNSNNNTIGDNTISSSGEECIWLCESNYNMVIGNTVSNPYRWEYKDCIYLSNSSNNAIRGNTITSLYSQGGIYLGSSNKNNISENSFLNSGLLIENSYKNSVSNNNSCDGKPLVYLEDELDTVIDIDAGQVILVNCDNITVKNQVLSNTSVGIELLDTHNTNIYDNKILKCRIGILVSNSSSDNLITGNDILNSIYSIQFCKSSYNTIVDNAMASEWGRGIDIDYSNNNIILGNTINAYMYGVYLSYSISNTISNNTIYISGIIFGECGIGVWESENNIISFNTLSSKRATGISLYSWSHNNLIFRNNITECGGSGISIDGNYLNRECKNNVISENIIAHNGGNGINIRWGCNLNFIEENNISSNGGNGISLSKNCEYTTILGNKITSNGGNGILIDENSNHANISENTIIYNVGSGVFITKEFVYVYWNSDYVTISRNNISFNEKWGVHLDGNYHRVFANNFIKNGDNAFFIKRKPYFESNSWCKWSDNYWDDLGSSNYKRLKGNILIFSGPFRDYFIPLFQFDWYPAKEPYDIGV